MVRRKFRLVTWKTGTQVLPNASGTQPFLFIASFYNFASIYFRHFWKALVVGVANWSQLARQSKQWFATMATVCISACASAKPWLDVVPLAWCAWWRPKTRRPDQSRPGPRPTPWNRKCDEDNEDKNIQLYEAPRGGHMTYDFYNSWNQLPNLTAWWMF